MPDARIKKFRTNFRFVLLASSVVGILLAGTNGLLMGRRIASPMDMALPQVAEKSSAPINSLESAQAAWNDAILRRHLEEWKSARQDTKGDPFSAALTAYEIGSASGDAHWSLLSIKLLDEVLEDNPDFVLARAWRGSAHALYARDYPFQGWWQAFPGPGPVRLYHVWAAFSDLNAAVDEAPTDPTTRLIRASTFIGMPGIFGGTDTGLEDFALLEDWTKNTSENPRNAGVLESHEWRAQYFLNRGRAMAKLQKSAEAKAAWQSLMKESNDVVDKDLARWHLK